MRPESLEPLLDTNGVLTRVIALLSQAAETYVGMGLTLCALSAS